MKKRHFFIGVGISLAVVLFLSIFWVEAVSAKECRLIKITSPAEPTRVTAIDPETFEISNGDCIFWANMSKNLVRVRFMGSLQCAVNPVGFDCEGTKKSFVTGYFGKGETRSLVIVKGGTYQYEIQTKNEPSVKTTGLIIVE